MDALPDAAYVYMVRCTGGQLYTGWTNHPAALRREAALKKLSKAEKEVLCAAWRAAGCPGVEND